MRKVTTFKQKYETIQKIGAGTMGIIYKVKKQPEYLSPGEDQIYASKHLYLNRIDLEIAKKQLKIIQQLKHKNIVKYHENFIQNNQLIIIMEYCGEKDLAFHIDKMKKNKKYFNENLVATWVVQLILGIYYIHSINVIHRDIKPQNIFVDENMHLKIGDFGVSKLLQGSQNSKTFAGSPLYISPELCNNEKYSKKTDIWSLGCVIHQICNLQKPFSTKQGFIQLLQVIKTKQPKPIPNIYPDNLSKLLKKMLIKDAAQRPTSQQLLLDQILVNMMIEYSSKQIDLKAEYQGSPLKSEKKQISDSFIEKQTSSVNKELKKFEEEVKGKISSFKNKKIHPNDVDRRYVQIQKKMKEIEKVVKIAFEELRMRSDANNQEQKSMVKSFKMDESDQTIRSVDLASKLKTVKLSDSDIDEVQSVMMNTSPKNIKQSGLDESKIFQSKIEQSKVYESKVQSSSRLNDNSEESMENEKTFQSQYMKTLSPSINFNKTMNKLEEVEKLLIQKPQLVMDETFMNYTLSLSNDLNLKSFNKNYKKLQETLNFDFSKKQYDQSFGKPISEDIIVEVEDSLDEQYEEDFEEFEEDKEMDIRQKQRKSVKQLFTTTLKSINLQNNDSQGEQNLTSQGFKSKYALSLSQIKQRSNEGGSILSRNEDLD